MTIVDNRTSNLNLPLPAAVNKLSDDVARLIAALNGIDASLASTIASLSGKASAAHSHAIGDTTGLQAALDQKIGTGTNLPISQVTDLQGALDARAPVNNASLTGAPTAAAASVGDNSTRIATTGWVRLQAYLTVVPDGAVVTAKIGDLAVTSAKLANSAVTAGKIANGGVDATAQLADGIVTPAKISNGAAASILGRSANSAGVRADIEAASAGVVLSRIGAALGFNTLTALLDAVFGTSVDRVLRRGTDTWEASALDLVLLSRIFQGVATPLETQTFDANGTWTNPALGSYVIIEGWAGGQGGARNATAASAFGGDGGTYGRIILPKVSLTGNQSVVIGQGGLGRSTAGVGLVGTLTSFGSIMSISGGGVLDEFLEPAPVAFTIPAPAAVSWAFGASPTNRFYQVRAAGLVSHASGSGALASTPTAPGTSTYGGNGGRNDTNAGAGVIPGGGGAGATTGTTGPGARGRLLVRTF